MKLSIACLLWAAGVVDCQPPVQIGPRPYWLIDQMIPNSLQEELKKCADEIYIFEVSDWSIGHRGSCLQFPEHTIDSYQAAIRMGAGIVECDVTFTKDLELVCRHAQCDLHTTTNIVTIPELNEKCTTPFQPGVEPKCCTSDFTLDELKTLCAKMDASGSLDSAEEYAFGGTPSWRTDLYSFPDVSCPQIPTHAESLELMASQNIFFTPELKSPQVDMPFTAEDGTEYSQDDYRQALVDDYTAANIPAEQVWLQSFISDDVIWWVNNAGDYGEQAVALDETGFGDLEEGSSSDWITLLTDNNVNYVAPPQQLLVEGDPEAEFRMKASDYSLQIKEAGLKIISWTSERAGPGLEGFYWDTLQNIDPVEGDRFNMLHVLNTEVGVAGVFSDWPATTTFYANCFGVGLRGSDSPAPTPSEPSTPTDDSCQTVAEIACDPSQADAFGTLCSLVQGSPAVADILSDESQTLTVFAPTNEAFDNAPPIGDGDIDDLLAFHAVVGQELMSTDLVCKETIAMANGQDSRTTCDNNVTPSVVWQRGADNVDTALPEIISADIKACNGVVHVVNNVMLPAQFLP